MKSITVALATILLVASGLVPRASSANTNEECGSTAKSLFSEAGTIVSDGGRQSAPVQASAGRIKPRDKPIISACRSNPPAPKKDASMTPAALPPVVPYSGLAFWVETLRCGAPASRRTTEYRFVTGDCAKFFFMPNVEGYLYVANVDSNNKVDYLFPQRGENNRLQAGEDANFGVEFVGSPGIERVFVFFSKVKIVDLPSLVLNLAARTATVRKDEQIYSVSLASEAGRTSTSKSLRRTDEVVSNATPDAARYVVIADSELVNLPVVVLTLNLVHTSH